MSFVNTKETKYKTQHKLCRYCELYNPTGASTHSTKECHYESGKKPHCSHCAQHFPSKAKTHRKKECRYLDAHDAPCTFCMEKKLRIAYTHNVEFCRNAPERIKKILPDISPCSACFDFDPITFVINPTHSLSVEFHTRAKCTRFDAYFIPATN